ncbi:MAG TPA: VWA domain-containing protein [Pyrinomonadaceae bacterium]|nr:VWA domain-containing protein [Pyrinomonadaceae bacterium]
MKARSTLGCFVVRLGVVICVAAGGCLAQTAEPDETIRIDTNLVDLKVRVTSLNREGHKPLLEQEDFQVFENGEAQEISFFAAADAPFDLVLLIDLSGSTAEKIKLIRRSAKAFVEATRPTDRVGIVTFSDTIQIISNLSVDRLLLKRLIDRIEKPVGGTNFWDSLNYVFGTMLSTQESSRRSAVIVMTDGVDNALPDVFGDGSQIGFTELLVKVRDSAAIVFPIYLDTEKEQVRRDRRMAATYSIARDQLAELADACGTVVYRANKLKDLEKVYQHVIRDIATVYSIGYSPSNPQRDGGWRSVSVRVRDKPGVAVHTKPGYYAKVVSER